MTHFPSHTTEELEKIFSYSSNDKSYKTVEEAKADIHLYDLGEKPLLSPNYPKFYNDIVTKFVLPSLKFDIHNINSKELNNHFYFLKQFVLGYDQKTDHWSISSQTRATD